MSEESQSNIMSRCEEDENRRIQRNGNALKKDGLKRQEERDKIIQLLFVVVYPVSHVKRFQMENKMEVILER